MDAENKSSQLQKYDLIIAGAGIAGCLSAVRLLASYPHLKILILEKEMYLGGRIRSHQSELSKSQSWGYGFSAISQEMFDFWVKSSSYLEDFDLNDYCEKRMENAAILAGSKFSTFNLDEFFGVKSARAMGGIAASKSWVELDQCLDRYRNLRKNSSKDLDDGTTTETESTRSEVEEAIEEDRSLESKSFANLWKGTRKDAAMIVAEPFALSAGIVDIWSSSLKAISELIEQRISTNLQGAWVNALQDMMQKLQQKFPENFFFKNSCRVVGAERIEASKEWFIRTECGEYAASALLVAQSPWACFEWLDKSLASPSVMNLPSKTRPVSLVCLSEKLKSTQTELRIENDIVFIPSEQSMAVFDQANGEIVFQMALDFEFSLQSLNVVKAIKALKRARRKLHAAMPELAMEGEHIALVPVAWPLSPNASDIKVLSKIEKNINQKHLFFCGDSYAFEFKSQKAILKSILKFQADFSKFNGFSFGKPPSVLEVDIAAQD